MENPTHTLYIRKISENISKNQIKRVLFVNFSPYGQILEIKLLKGLKFKSQAWITYENIESAILAKKSLNFFYLFDTPIEIQFSPNKNIIINKILGKYNPYGRNKKEIEPELIEKLSKGPIPYHWDYPMEIPEKEEIPQIIQPKEIPKIIKQNIILHPPNKILFVQQIPDYMNLDMINILFGQYPGFIEARLVPNLKGIAFIEFENEEQSSLALTGMNGFTIDSDHILSVQFSRN